MKRILVLVLAIAVAAVSFAAGGQETTASQGPSMSAPGVFPIVSETVEMRVLTPQDVAVSDYEDNAFTQYMEDTTNVHVKWDLVALSELNAKINLLLASQVGLPDVYLGTNQGGAMSDVVLVQYGAEGAFVPLNDLIEQQGYEFPKVLELRPDVLPAITAPDGNIYSLPRISECYNCRYSVKLWLNQTFMEVLGLEMPSTTAEFAVVLRAIRDGDPNGNGKADEIPLMGATNGWNQQPDSFLMNSFVYYNRGNPYTFEDGRIVAPFVTDEWRDGLRYMSQLVEERLLDPVSFTQNQNQLRQLVEEDPMRVGAVTSGGFHVFTNPNSDRKTNYVVVSPLEGPTGLRHAWQQPSDVGTGAFVISSSSKIPEIALKWADHFFNVEVTARGRLGVPGVDWVEPDSDALGSLGNPALSKEILRWGSVQNSHWQFRQPGYWPLEWVTGQQIPDNDPYPLQLVLDTSTRDKMLPYAPSDDLVVPPLQFTVDEAAEMSDYGSTILSYVRESLARFVVGDLDIDSSDWNTYLAEFRRMNLDRVLEIMQTAYERQWQ